MLMKKLIYCLILCLLLIACGQKTQPSLTTLVNPLIGTSSTFQFSHGNTYPAVAVPWGMNFWSRGSSWAPSTCHRRKRKRLDVYVH